MEKRIALALVAGQAVFGQGQAPRPWRSFWRVFCSLGLLSEYDGRSKRCIPSY